MDDSQKNAVMIAIIAACITIIILMWLWSADWYVQYPVTILVAAGVGAGAYYAAKSMS